MPAYTDKNVTQGYLERMYIMVKNDTTVNISKVCNYNYNVSGDYSPNITLIFDCYNVTIGRYVTIRRGGGYLIRTLAICDVMVIADYVQQDTCRFTEECPFYYT